MKVCSTRSSPRAPGRKNSAPRWNKCLLRHPPEQKMAFCLLLDQYPREEFGLLMANSLSYCTLHLRPTPRPVLGNCLWWIPSASLTPECCLFTWQVSEDALLSNGLLPSDSNWPSGQARINSILTGDYPAANNEPTGNNICMIKNSSGILSNQLSTFPTFSQVPLSFFPFVLAICFIDWGTETESFYHLSPSTGSHVLQELGCKTEQLRVYWMPHHRPGMSELEVEHGLSEVYSGNWSKCLWMCS
jgi:hypothetical protein